MKNNELFLGNSIASDYIKRYDYPFEVLPNIKNIILDIGSQLGNDYILLKENVWISKTVDLPSNVVVIGPCIIDHDAKIRTGAFIRENVIIGKNSVLGNSCEIKNSILYDNVEVPHFNYVGDSILGEHAHMGAGSITSNLKSDKQNVVIKGEEIIETHLRKVGAFLGDNVEIGCNSVLNPGTVIGRGSIVYPLVMVRGVIKENKIVKSMNNIVDKELR